MPSAVVMAGPPGEVSAYADVAPDAGGDLGGDSGKASLHQHAVCQLSLGGSFPGSQVLQLQLADLLQICWPPHTKTPQQCVQNTSSACVLPEAFCCVAQLVTLLQ